MYYEILPYKNSRFAKYVLASLLNCIARTQIFHDRETQSKVFCYSGCGDLFHWEYPFIKKTKMVETVK